MKIGFIGLGHMGNPMVRNLLKHQHEVLVFDVVAEAIKKLVEEGATATSMTEIAKQCDVVFTMLQTGEQVKNVCSGENGLFAHLSAKVLFIDSSSIDIQTSRDLHALAHAKNIAMLDAPVSGGVAGAEAATLTFMVGGDENHLQRAMPILQCMGKKIVHAGQAGNGQAAKICNNMLLGISMIGVCETFTLAEKLGLAADKLFEISSNASGQCWSLTSYAPVPGLVKTSPANNEYKPGFTAKMMLKDLLLSQTAAHNVGAATPLGAEATALYTLFVNEGYADLDFSGIIKMIAGKDH